MSRTVIARGAKTSRPLYRQVKTEHGFSSVPDGRELITYMVEIDTGTLDSIACKAARNTRGVSRAGALIVTVTDRKTERGTDRRPYEQRQ